MKTFILFLILFVHCFLYHNAFTFVISIAILVFYGKDIEDWVKTFNK